MKRVPKPARRLTERTCIPEPPRTIGARPLLAPFFRGSQSEEYAGTGRVPETQIPPVCTRFPSGSDSSPTPHGAAPPANRTRRIQGQRRRYRRGDAQRRRRQGKNSAVVLRRPRRTARRNL